MKKIKKLLVANRGEIAIRIFRAASELGIRTIAIYSREDTDSLFRLKADESYLIGKNKGPIEAYLNIQEIIALAKRNAVDAIHPGYGFLSENADFAKQCEENGIIFIGPDHEMMQKLGDKVTSKILAKSIGIPVIDGIDGVIGSEAELMEFAETAKFPIMLKASAGGGGRGMRIVRNKEDVLRAYTDAKNEALKAFGNDAIFAESYLEDPKHIEVQILGDNYGNIVHLYERDCSIQRRHQKVIEFTPALTLSPEKKQALYNDALKIARSVNYRNAGTVEFLVDKHGNHYFIEVNPRIQVEHTITEMVTGVDIVQSQILIAMGYELASDKINIKSQEDVHCNGHAIQCRVTTEDPANNLFPDAGKITNYRSGSGAGVRLDAGNAYAGAEVSPYYDSLLLKVSAWSRSMEDAKNKAIRAIKEISVEGVKTNIGFLINILHHDEFVKGICDTNFIAKNTDLYEISNTENMESRLMEYIGDVVVNVSKGNKENYDVPVVPDYDSKKFVYGSKQIFDERGAAGLVDWIKSQDQLLYTDTTFRDAHQSLMATRIRTRDMLRIAPAVNFNASELFSLEMWGGATFDVAMRFLGEDPWDRLRQIRQAAPNILMQMLLRGSNAVGYKNYPDNVIRKFIEQASKNGIDLFRIFDSLNWLEGMKVSIDEVLKQGKIAEVCMCYTGDVLDKSKTKYNLEYYINMAKEIEKTGAHILGIKDMSALLKPYAAFELITELKKEIKIPIHLHTHDTTGNGVATLLMAAQAGVDIVDVAFNSMASLTSQPALGSVVAALKNTKLESKLDLRKLEEISDYWDRVRNVYKKFESELKSTASEIYEYEIPGGQYSNLKSQVDSFNLLHKFKEIKETYRDVNELFGDIIKVTPSSKAVGDMAIFMVQNGLTKDNIFEKGKDMDYPDSVEAFFSGMMGQPEGGFPEKLQKIVLKDKEPITGRAGELLEPEDFDAIKKMLREELELEGTDEEAVSYALYPKVFVDFIKTRREKGDFSNLGSDVFFHGLRENETASVEISKGNLYTVKLVEIGKVNAEGKRRLLFDINGNRREVLIEDKTISKGLKKESVKKARKDEPRDVCSYIPGQISKILVKEGDKVELNQSLLVVEAMKMETEIKANMAGTVAEILLKEGDGIEAYQLIMTLE
ncbi:MAG: pyruvate carboxylase [Bacillota bacterium]|nr:pyruvate carboxylase [Bacillota bacterium]